MVFLGWGLLMVKKMVQVFGFCGWGSRFSRVLFFLYEEGEEAPGSHLGLRVPFLCFGSPAFRRREGLGVLMVRNLGLGLMG